MSDSVSIKDSFAHVQHVQRTNNETIKAHHQKLENANRLRLKENLLMHNEEKTEMNELMLKAYHERIDRLLTYNQYATVVKPLMEQGKIINIEA